MSSMVPKYRIVIKIGGMRYIASRDKRPLPWVSWYTEDDPKRRGVCFFTKEEAMAIADKYDDQKPTIEKLSKIAEPTS